MSSSDSLSSDENVEEFGDSDGQFSESSGDEETDEDPLEDYLAQEEQKKTESVDLETPLKRLDERFALLENLVDPSVWSKVVDFQPPSFLPHLRIGFLGNSGIGKTTTMNHLLSIDNNDVLRNFLPSSGSNAATAAICEIVGWKRDKFAVTVEFITWETWLEWYESARNDFIRMADEGFNTATSDSVEFLETILNSFWHGKELDDLVKRTENTTAASPTSSSTSSVDTVPAAHWSKKKALEAIPPDLAREAFPEPNSTEAHCNSQEHTFDPSKEETFKIAAQAVSDTITKYCFAGPPKTSKTSSQKPNKKNSSKSSNSSSKSNNSSKSSKSSKSSNSSSKSSSRNTTSPTHWQPRIWPLVSKVTVCGPFSHLAEHGYSLIDIPGNNDEVGLRQERYNMGRRMSDSICYFSNPARYGMASELLSLPVHQRDCLIVTRALSLEDFPSPNVVKQALCHEHPTKDYVFEHLKILPVENLPIGDDAKVAAEKLIDKVRGRFAYLAYCRRNQFLSYINAQWDSLCSVSRVDSAAYIETQFKVDYDAWKQNLIAEMDKLVASFKLVGRSFSVPTLHEERNTHYSSLQAAMRHDRGNISWPHAITSVLVSQPELAYIRLSFEGFFRQHLTTLCELPSFPKSMFDTEKLLKLLMDRSQLGFWDWKVRSILGDLLETEYRPTWRGLLAVGAGCRDVMIYNINSWWIRKRVEVGLFAEHGLSGTLLGFFDEMTAELDGIISALQYRLENIAALQREQVKQIFKPLGEEVELPNVANDLQLPKASSERASYLYALQMLGGAWLIGYTWSPTLTDYTLAVPQGPRLRTFMLPPGASTIPFFSTLKEDLEKEPHHYLIGENPVVLAPESVILNAIERISLPHWDSKHEIDVVNDVAQSITDLHLFLKS